MIPIWPQAFPQAPRRNNWTGGPIDERLRFTPDRGPAIERVGATALTEEFTATFQNFSTDQRAAFRDWFAGDLSSGVNWFAWRDPVLEDVALWRIVGGNGPAYSFAAKGAGWHDLTVKLMRHPADPWFAPYASGGVLRLPFVVADYARGVFGVDLARKPAAAVALVAGTFDVFSTRPGQSTLVERGRVVTAGGIPAAAPAGVSRILAFPVLA